MIVPIRTLWGLANFLLLQWFFVRLARVEDENGKCAVGLMRWIWPLTGWWSRYVYLVHRAPWFPGYKVCECDHRLMEDEDDRYV